MDVPIEKPTKYWEIAFSPERNCKVMIFSKITYIYIHFETPIKIKHKESRGAPNKEWEGLAASTGLVSIISKLC